MTLTIYDEENILKMLKDSLKHIFDEYVRSGELDTSLENELTRIDWKLQHIQQQRDRRFKNMLKHIIK